MTGAITAQLERYAPGFRDLVLQSNVVTAAQLGDYNRNYIGGDFSVGTMDLRGLVQRPVVSRVPWRTPLSGVYLCSSSTPPGPGVTGMPGLHAATYALKDIFKLPLPALGLDASAGS
jgi:phytoene dehydrogenase-like protein